MCNISHTTCTPTFVVQQVTIFLTGLSCLSLFSLVNGLGSQCYVFPCQNLDGACYLQILYIFSFTCRKLLGKSIDRIVLFNVVTFE